MQPSTPLTAQALAFVPTVTSRIVPSTLTRKNVEEEQQKGSSSAAQRSADGEEAAALLSSSRATPHPFGGQEDAEDSSSYTSQRDEEGWVVASRGEDVLAPLLAQYPELKRNYMLPSLEELELKRRLQQGVARVTVDAILERYRRIRLVRAHRERCLREMRMENIHEEFGFDDDDYPFWRPLVTYADLPRSVRQLIFGFMPAISTPFELDLQYLIRVLQVNNASAVRNPEEAMKIVKAVEQNLVTHKHMYGKFAVLAWALGIPTISKNTYGQQVHKLEEETPYALLTMAGGVGTIADDVRYGNGNEKGGGNTTTIKFLSPRLVLKELAQRKRIEEEARQLTLAHHRREQQLDLFREGVVLLNPATKARQLGEGRRRHNDKNNRSNNTNNNNITLFGDENGDEARGEANRASAAIDKLLLSISADEGEEDTERFTNTSQQGFARRKRASSVFSTSSTAVSSSTANGGGGRTVVVEEGPPSALVALATAAFELKEEAQRNGDAFAVKVEIETDDVGDSGVDTADHLYSRAGLVRSPVPAAASRAQLQESPAEYGEPDYMSSSSPRPPHQEAKVKEDGSGLPLSPLTIRAHTSSPVPPTSRRGERSLSSAHDSGGVTPANLPSPSSAAAGSGASLALAVRRRVSVMETHGKALGESSSTPTAGAGVILSPGRRYPNPQHHHQSSSLKKENSVLSSVAASTNVILYDARLMRSALDKHPQRQRVRSMLNLTTQLIRRLYDKIKKYKQWRDFREKVFSTTCRDLRPNLRQAIAEWEAQLLAWRKERCVVVVELPTLEEQNQIKRRARAKEKKVAVMVALSVKSKTDNTKTDGDDGYDHDEDTFATDDSPRAHTKGPQTITVDNRDVVSEVALHELYYIKRRLGAVEFIGDPKIEMDDVKAMFRACGIDSSVVPSEDHNYALLASSATPKNDANRTDRENNGLNSSTPYLSPNPNRSSSSSSSSPSYSAFVVPMVSEASYASTLTFSQCSTLGLLDVPWVNGYAWQDKEGALISEETPEARRARGETVSYDQTRIGSLYPPRAVGTGGVGATLVKTMKNEMETTPNAPKELAKFVNKVEADSGGSSSSSRSSSSSSRSMLGGHTRNTRATRHDGVTPPPPKKMSALEKVSALMGLRSQKRAGIDTSSSTESKTKDDAPSQRKREQQKGDNKIPPLSSVVSSREREGKAHSSREGHLKVNSEVSTSLTSPVAESAFTYTVGLVDEENDQCKREAAARAEAAEKAQLLRARDVAVTAMSQRVWRPHLAFKPRQYHAFGGCELCSDPLVIHLGMAKPGGGACGDIVVCGPCYLECYSIGDDSNTKRALAESASKTNAPLTGGGNEALSFSSPAETERRRKENRHIHAMYDWYFIRDLVGLGRDGDGNVSTVVSSSTAAAAGLFPSNISAPSVSLSVSSQQSPTSWIPTGIMRRGVGLETGGTPVGTKKQAEDDNAYSSGRQTPLVVLIPSRTDKANSLARSFSGEEKHNAADEPVSPRAVEYRQDKAEATEEGNDDVPPPALLSSTQNGTNRL